MIKEFVDIFMEHKEELREKFKVEPPESYASLVKTVIELLNDDGYGDPDPEKIHLIDDGNYQGTLLFIIPEDSYQPSTYWYVKVGYGSCSGCDTLQGIKSSSEYDYDNDCEFPPNDQQLDDYMTLALHIVQGLKRME